MNALWRVLEPAIGAATGQPLALRQREPVGGGCIHQAWRVGDGNRTYFVKVNDAAYLPLFEAETAGLAELAALLGLDRREDFADAEPESPKIALWVGRASAAVRSPGWRGRRCTTSPSVGRSRIGACKPYRPMPIGAGTRRGRHE